MSDDPFTPSSVPLGLLRRYLVAHGWRRLLDANQTPTELPPQYERIGRLVIEGRTDARRNFEVYLLVTPGFDDVEIVLPRYQNTSDFLARMRTAIRTLSDLEDRSADLIIADIRGVGFDIVRSRIPDELVRNDAVHLSTAVNYIAGVKTLLAATATTEIDPVPHFLRVRKEALEYADACQFAHTFRGSFGFTIESPVSPNIAPTFLDIPQDAPFERRVISRFARGVDDICEAVRRDNVDVILTDFDRGFGANALDQFADLVESTARTGMTFSFSFSPEWPVPDDLARVRELRVGPQHIDVTREAAKSLRTQPVAREEQLFGRIVRLQTEADPTDLETPIGDREVAIQWSHEDLGDIQVRALLNPADYLTAIEAHRNGRPVRVSGTLEKRGRRWVLSNPTGLTIPE
jgi:hypothetical protein